MARIRPFTGLRYDLPRVGSASDLLAPPYDVVDEAKRAALAARSEANSIRFVLPEGEGDSKYAHGAEVFRTLVRTAMLRDPEPGVYLYDQAFTSEGERYVRKGFIALVELTRFGHGPVLAHERTLAGPKADRLKLMRAVQAHLELVFGLFSDPARTWEAITTPVRGEPLFETVFDGTEHALYRVSDPTALGRLTAHLADKSIYIADGHHRYETMCTFRDELEASGHPDPAYGLIYLSNLDDPGLVVLPTHRLVHGLAAVDLATVLASVSPWFETTEEPLPATATALRKRLMLTTPGSRLGATPGSRLGATPDSRPGAAASEGTAHGAAFGLAVPGTGRLHVLRLRSDFDPASAGLAALPSALSRLDVVLLHELVLERALGIGKQAQEANTNLRYYKSTEQALEVAASGDGGTQVVCFMNATPVADVRAVCDSGQVMPQKSTFFHPKIPNGLVFYDLERP